MTWCSPLTERAAEIGWVLSYYDELRVDALRYYGVDIDEMDGPTVMNLAYYLQDVVDVDYNADPPRIASAVFAAVRRNSDSESADSGAEVRGTKTGTISMAARAAQVQATRALEAVDADETPVEGVQYVGWNPIYGVPDGEVVTV